MNNLQVIPILRDDYSLFDPVGKFRAPAYADLIHNVCDYLLTLIKGHLVS
jgi:hypothetical protein